MASKRRLSSSPSPEPTDINRSRSKFMNSPKPDVCLVCGDKARIINYGALSCQSCKTFFRRNGFRPETVRPCVFTQPCEISMQTRHNCTACRLAKCFSVGMSSDLIRKEDRKKEKLSPIKSDDTKQITTVPQLFITDFDRDDQSLLGSSEWKLLSNILYAYDTYSAVQPVCQKIQNLSILSSELQSESIKPFKIINQMFISVQTFVNSSPEFRILTINEQMSLFERNLHGMVGFYSILFFRDTNILNNITCMEAFTDIYGSELILLIKKFHEELDIDSTSIKLALMVLAFSLNCFTLNQQNNTERDSLIHGTFRISGSQNVYLELLWKYMIYRYGYHESIIRFSRFIRIFLCISKRLSAIYMNNGDYQKMIDKIIEDIKVTVRIHENELVPLWGKT